MSYVDQLKKMKKVWDFKKNLGKIMLKLALFQDVDSWTDKHDVDINPHMISFNVVCDDLLHFHRQLLENLSIVQRTQHPQIEAFVSMCGIPQIPWQSLYFKRYGTAYSKLRVSHPTSGLIACRDDIRWCRGRGEAARAVLLNNSRHPQGTYNAFSRY